MRRLLVVQFTHSLVRALEGRLLHVHKLGHTVVASRTEDELNDVTKAQLVADRKRRINELRELLEIRRAVLGLSKAAERNAVVRRTFLRRAGKVGNVNCFHVILLAWRLPGLNEFYDTKRIVI